MNIEALDETVWDAVIAGTGLRESLLAAALARAGKKVLHLDRNPYYGDEYAALSLDELEAWAKDTGSGRRTSVQYETHHTPDGSGLQKSRAYAISLSPGLIYTASPILSLLVKSGLHEALEFLKFGGWFVHDAETPSADPLKRVPNSREDIFNDKTLDPRTKRVVVRALKSMVGLEGSSATNGTSDRLSLQEYLEQSSFRLPPSIIAAFASLTLSHDPPNTIPFKEAEQAIKRHFDSLGRFGAGFSAVIGRYGSGSELVQVLCRAAAVTGNSVYVLGNEILNIQNGNSIPSTSGVTTEAADPHIQLSLQSGDTIQTRHVVGVSSNLPTNIPTSRSTLEGTGYWMSIYVISGSLEQALQTEEPPPAAGAVAYIPAGSIKGHDSLNTNPIYVVVHGSDTGECPDGQSILYASMKVGGASEGEFLDSAVNSLLQKLASGNSATGQILLSVKFRTYSDPEPLVPPSANNIHVLPDHTPMIDIPDLLVEQTMEVYEKIVGTRAGFLEKIVS
ncbi:Rab proteins geranylgeranyltransferase component A [Orbilia blumenaviensis]|uniref:Rab proteins geranylgeranyltransferase component A n=1 Tax=Orbilia blumenaviensis TaxID=1796055 RepID=A0AAV9UW84_9PEZI